MKIGLVGDYSENVTAHRAIPIALDLSSRDLSINLEIHWINSEDIPQFDLGSFSGLWCVPASPYKSMENVLQLINFARNEDIPFLGTCGGYQHAALEFARNALGFSHADNGEVNPDAEMPLISALVCKLVEVTDKIQLEENSRIANIYSRNLICEEYRCSFGVNREYLPIFDGSEMRFTGSDSEGDPRVLEIQKNHFFIGTAFQPERSALRNQSHPIVRAFLEAAKNS
jgi:CTP synthase (UTP-ammonia lyase)